MVQGRENWAEVTGRVLSIAPAGEGYQRIELAVQHAADVAPMPNFFRERVGSTVTVELPGDSVRDARLERGSTLTARLRLATPALAFADPDLVRRVD
jgi:hypothetical protein